MLARRLTSKELKITKGTLKEALAYYEANTDEATKLIAVGESKPGNKVPPTQLAAMTMVANQLLNLDEVLNK